MVRLDTPWRVDVMDRDMIPFLQAKSAAEKLPWSEPQIGPPDNSWPAAFDN